MKHQGTKQLGTERLILRRFVMEDAQAMYQNWACDGEVTKYLTWPPHSSPDVSHMVLSDWTARYAQADYYQWTIELKELNEPIGSIAVVEIRERVDELVIGYCIGRPWWGKGIVAEAGKAVIAYLFDQVEANRISATHDANNPNSGRVMKKIGMQYEGTHRQGGKNNQGIVDEVVYAILKDDWKNSIE